MSTILELGVEKDHIESLTRANGINALSELLWNSLDADATEINVRYRNSPLDGLDYIEISDNGHGLIFDDAKEIFSKLGGSKKKTKTLSPSGRLYHGKEGKGRYKGLALGDLIKFTSVYESGKDLSEFSITINKNQIAKTEISDSIKTEKSKNKTGFQVQIWNVNQKNAEHAIKLENRRDLEEKFASYWLSYPNFRIFINEKEFDFNSLIKNSEEKDIKLERGEVTHDFLIKILEWNFENKKKTYLCNSKGIPFQELPLGIRSSLPISIFIQSDYIEKLKRENQLDLHEGDEVMNSIIKTAKDLGRDYVRSRLHEYSKEYILELKRKGIYPYKDPADNIIEESKRQVFDIVALQLNEYLPSFKEQDDNNQKLTLFLVSEALNNGSKSFQRILGEFLELPEEQRKDLAELLDSTSLSNIIDAMTEVKNRLNFLNGLEQIIYDKDKNKHILERQHLHKVIIQETWIFGDEYTYGVDDLTLKNVLKAYLKDNLKRDDFEEVVNSEDNDHLETIPDVCLWQQYSLGSSGKENLVIELKRPSLNAGLIEMSQIMGYASNVSNDRRFPKEKTKWKFVLVTKDVKDDLAPQLRQKNRKFGHVTEGENFDVFILSWGDIISEAKQRHEFIKDKLNLNLQDETVN